MRLTVGGSTYTPAMSTTAATTTGTGTLIGYARCSDSSGLARSQMKMSAFLAPAAC